MKKTLTMVLALVLVFALGVGGTLAWLNDKTEAVTNVFTPSTIGVTLVEEAGGTTKQFKMVPGHTITKDPKATVVADSEDCYLFVKIEKSANYDTYLEEYNIAEGWTEHTDGVYYRVFDSKDTANTNVMGTPYSVLEDDQVKVKESVTKEMMDAIKNGEADEPTLTFTAYATQLYKNNTEKFEVSVAWTNAQAN